MTRSGATSTPPSASAPASGAGSDQQPAVTITRSYGPPGGAAPSPATTRTAPGAGSSTTGTAAARRCPAAAAATSGCSSTVVTAAPSAAQQRGVVAGPGADLEHAVAGPHREQLEHAGHQARLARGARRHAALVAGDDGVVGVDGVERDAGQEEMARHARERVQHRVADARGRRGRPHAARRTPRAARARRSCVARRRLVLERVQQLLGLGDRAVEERLLDDAALGERRDRVVRLVAAR